MKILFNGLCWLLSYGKKWYYVFYGPKILNILFIIKYLLNILNSLDILTIFLYLADQCLELRDDSTGESISGRGQVIVSLLSRDGSRGEPASATGEGSPLAVVGPAGEVRAPREPPGNSNKNPSQSPLPPQWEERFTSGGRLVLVPLSYTYLHYSLFSSLEYFNELG